MFFGRPKKPERSRRDRQSSQPGADLSAQKGENSKVTEDGSRRRKEKKQSSKEERHGLFVLYPGNRDTAVDIVALHGLGGHAFNTWTDEEGHLWLRDSLPSHVPNARIMTFGYDSAIWSGSKSTILEFAIDLLERLRIIRQTSQEKRRSILFICHSLGGLVCKKALIVAHEQPQYTPLIERVQGIIFMGTPHRGSKLASLATPLSNIVNLALLRKRVRTELLNNLEISSTTIIEITMSAVHRLATLEIVSFYEQKILEPLGCRIVEPFSAILGLPNEKALPISADHRNMVRLSPTEKEKYRPVWTAIAEIVANCSSLTEGKSKWVEARGILDILYCVDYSRFLLDTPTAHPGSCSWLVESKVFLDWMMEASSGAFWLFGHPGRGKTVLSRFVIETLKNVPVAYLDLHQLQPFTVIHYILLEQDKERGSITAILRSFLHQLILEDPSVVSIIQHYFGLERGNKNPEESPNILWDAFRGVLELDRMKRIVVVVDGLDELDYVTLESLISGLSSIIMGIRDHTSDRRIKLFVTSRPNESINELFRKLNPTKMEIISRSGIESFVRNEVLEFGRRNQFPEHVSHQIIAEIVKKADGMFLWASLAWTNFREGVTIWSKKTISSQLEALQKLPKGLSSLYSSLLAKLDQSTLQELQPLFQCMVVAHRPLSCNEMAEALAVNGCETHHELETAFSIAKTIETSCPNFAKIDNNGTIRFVHQSVKDFFADSVASMDLMSAHAAMAKICITYLSFNDLPSVTRRWSYQRYGDLAEINKEFPFLYYCSSWLYTHVDPLPHNNELWASFSRLLRHNKCDAYERSAFHEPMMLAINKNSRDLIKTFLGAGCSIEDKLYDSPPIHYAIKTGKVDLAFFLLENGAQVNSRDEQKRTPLHFAIRDRHDNLVETLMSYKELDINLQDVDGRTPLHWAVMGLSEALLRKILTDPRTNMGITDNDRRTPLTYAAYWGQKAGVRTILENSTSLQQHHAEDLSPVICAAQQGWRDLTLELVTRVSDINHHRGRDRKGFLHWAAINNWDEVIQVAVDKAGAKFSQIDTSGKTPLHYAAELGNHAAAKCLVRCGASSQVGDNIGITAIQLAAKEGFADVLNLLLQESDYDVNAKDAQGNTLLHWAASWDWASIIRIVIEHPDVDLSIRNGYGRTALHIAALCGCPNVLKILLEVGHYDINQVDGCGNSLLHLASTSNIYGELLKYPLLDLKRRNKFGHLAINSPGAYHKTIALNSEPQVDPLDEKVREPKYTDTNQEPKDVRDENWGVLTVSVRCAFKDCEKSCAHVDSCKGCKMYFCESHKEKQDHLCNLQAEKWKKEHGWEWV